MDTKVPAWLPASLVAFALLAAAASAGIVVSEDRSDEAFVTEEVKGLEFVPVGNPGNAADTNQYGAVDYDFSIGKYEVTAGQYTRFLNAVAASDPNELYNPLMWSSSSGCKIERIGVPGSYTYRVAAGYANRPVNYVSWYDAARFANWLTTGDTEQGVYHFTAGRLSDVAGHEQTTGDSGTIYFLPTENEWYKAAYHANDGIAGNYRKPPSGGNVPPGSAAGVHNASFHGVSYPIDSPTYSAALGEFDSSPGPYGTFDQSGNVWEWIETLAANPRAVRRGGSFHGNGVCEMVFCARDPSACKTNEDCLTGFRVARRGESGTSGGDSASAAPPEHQTQLGDADGPLGQIQSNSAAVQASGGVSAGIAGYPSASGGWPPVASSTAAGSGAGAPAYGTPAYGAPAYGAPAIPIVPIASSGGGPLGLNHPPHGVLDRVAGWSSPSPPNTGGALGGGFGGGGSLYGDEISPAPLLTEGGFGEQDYPSDFTGGNPAGEAAGSTVAPEPASILIWGGGGVACLLFRRRR